MVYNFYKFPYALLHNVSQLFYSQMGAAKGFSKAPWKSVLTPQEALEKLTVPSGTTVCGFHVASEKQLNTTATGLREICEN